MSKSDREEVPTEQVAKPVEATKPAEVQPPPVVPEPLPFGKFANCSPDKVKDEK